MPRNLVKNADHELKLNEIYYDAATTSWFSGIKGAVSVFGILFTIVAACFHKFNLLNCILRSIIKRSTDVHVENDGTFSFALSHNILPKIDVSKSLKWRQYKYR